MRFAPPPTVRNTERPGGMNQVLARSFNERLIMSMLLQNESMTRLEIGQKSGLSAQTISVIVRALERDNLIIKGEAVRGRVGPPSTPIRLNPNGAFSIGLHIDQGEIEAVLINFVGDASIGKTVKLKGFNVTTVQEGLVEAYDHVVSEISSDQRANLTGVGITLPTQFDATATDASDVLKHDFETFMSEYANLEVFIQNDITAAASAEMLFGEAKSIMELLYCYVSGDLKPRLILGGRIYSGSNVDTKFVNCSNWNSIRNELRDDANPYGKEAADWVISAGQNISALLDELNRFATVSTLIFSSPAAGTAMQQITDIVKSKENISIAIKPSSLGPNAIAIGAASLPIHSKLKLES